jgi:hypothetical protein
MIRTRAIPEIGQTMPTNRVRALLWAIWLLAGMISPALATEADTAVADPEGRALVEPDKPYAKVHNWRISTARFGVGCIAEYSSTGISVGGDKWDKLALLILVERKTFDGIVDERPRASRSSASWVRLFALRGCCPNSEVNSKIIRCAIICLHVSAADFSAEIDARRKFRCWN